MSVVASQEIRRRIWRGYDDPGLPVAVWQGRVTVTGDASGGSATLQIELWPEAQPGAGHFFNLEALEMTDSQGGGDFQLLFINFGMAIAGAFANREWTIPMTFNQGNNGAIAINDQLAKPIFLGQPSIPAGRAALSVLATNDDGTVYDFYAEGYVWEPRSVQAQGGLRRPVGSLWG